MLGGMEEQRRSHESSATPGRPAPRSAASPTRAPASAAETSTAQGKPASATPSATAHAHGASAQHVLFFLIFLYLLAHGGILLQQVQLWLRDVLTGLPLMRTLLIMHEVVTLGCGVLLSRAMTSSAHADELPERAFVQFAFIIPLFQCLYVAVSPTAWDGERKWWGFQATLSLLSVLCRCRPSHSLLHAIFSGLTLT